MATWTVTDGGTYTWPTGRGTNSADTIYISNGTTITTQVEMNGGADNVTLIDSFFEKGVGMAQGNDNLTVSGTNALAPSEFGDTGGNAITLGAGADVINVTGYVELNGDFHAGIGDDDVTFDIIGSVDGVFEGMAGNDTLTILGGNYTNVDGGDDSDTINISGGVFSAEVTGGAGNDTLNISGGDFTDILGEGGSDIMSISGGTTSGTIDGGDLADSIDVTGGTHNNVDGGTGNDNITLDGGTVTGTIFGGDGADIVQVLSGNAFDLDGGAGEDSLVLVDGDVTGTMFGGIGNDTIVASGGTVNNIDGGEGDDAITISTAEVTGVITGGEGSDNIAINNPAGNIVVDGSEDADGNDFDVLDLTGLGATYTLDETNPENGVATTQNGETITFTNIENVVGATFIPPVCFTRGMKIETERGEVAVEDLKIGDRLKTLDRGYQPVRYIWSRWYDATGADAPIRFKAGSIGNSEDLVVSQKHRMYVKSLPNHYWYEEETLVHADRLIDGETIFIDSQIERVEYYHIMLDRHELLYCHGTISESWQPHRKNLKRDPEIAKELNRLFPEIAKQKNGKGGDLVRFELVDVLDRRLPVAAQADVVKKNTARLKEVWGLR